MPWLKNTWKSTRAFLENRGNMKKIRVLHIGTSGEKGGIDSFIINMCSHLNADEYEFSIIADCEKTAIENEFQAAGVSVIYVPSAVKSKIRYASALWHVIRRKDFDVVHCHKNSLANPLPIIIGVFKRIPLVIVHSHNTHATQLTASGKVHNAFKKILKRMNVYRLACSDKAAEWLFGDDYQKQGVMILKNGIDLTKYRFNGKVRGEVRQELGIHSDQTLAICNVGRLSEQKNSLFILRIFDALHRIEPDSRLFMVGTGELEDEVKAVAGSLESSESISFLGRRSDVNRLYQGVDLFLMPSLHEGLPIAAVEAQTASLPLLISDTVDSDVRLTDQTEFESLQKSAEEWAKHCLLLARRSERCDCSKQITKAGYNIEDSVQYLDHLYKMVGVVRK